MRRRHDPERRSHLDLHGPELRERDPARVRPRRQEIHLFKSNRKGGEI